MKPAPREGHADDLMSVLGHELRSPLTAIRGAASLLLMAQAELPGEKVTELLRVIDSEAARMADRVEDVLVAGRLDGSRQRVMVEEVELSDVLADCLEDARGQATGRRLRVSRGLDGVRVRADLQRLSQILRILLDNAIRFSPPGSPIEVRVEKRQTRVRIEVRDRGPGIAREDRERIFERGVKLDPSRPGAGLGLYIVRGLTDLMAGGIGVDARSGGGAAFWVTLPPVAK